MGKIRPAITLLLLLALAFTTFVCWHQDGTIRQQRVQLRGLLSDIQAIITLWAAQPTCDTEITEN